MIKVGNTNVSALKVGSTNVSAAYFNGEQVFGGSGPTPWYVPVDYIWAEVNSTWKTQHNGLAYGWLPVEQFVLDIDSVQFNNQFRISRTPYTRSTTGMCLCTTNDNSGTTVQQHNSAAGTYMQTIRIYDSDLTNASYRIDSNLPDNPSSLTSQITFSINKPTYSGTPGISQDLGWVGTSTKEKYNSCRQYYDGSTITYLRLAIDSTQSGTRSSEIHSFVVSNNGNTVINVIPILITTTNKYALYDTISGNYVDRLITDDNYIVYFSGE